MSGSFLICATVASEIAVDLQLMQRIERDSAPDTRNLVSRSQNTQCLRGTANCPARTESAISRKYLVYLLILNLRKKII